MPIYEYQCAACNAVTDIKHGFKEVVDQPCPTCGGALKRLFRPAGIVFKGSGFYVTDSRKSGGGEKPSGGDKPAEKAADKPAEATAPKAEKKDGGKGDAAA